MIIIIIIIIAAVVFLLQFLHVPTVFRSLNKMLAFVGTTQVEEIRKTVGPLVFLFSPGSRK